MVTVKNGYSMDASFQVDNGITQEDQNEINKHTHDVAFVKRNENLGKRHSFGQGIFYKKCDLSQITVKMLIRLLRTGRICASQVARFRFGLTGKK